MEVTKQTIMDNITNGTDLDYEPYESRIETYLAPIIFSIIFVTGIVGNWTVCAIFIKHSSMRNVPNTYIFSLAVGDLLVILICVPTAGIPYIYDQWPWEGRVGDLICRGSEFARDVSTGVSIFTLVALAFDRYMAVVNPLKKLQARSKKIRLIIAMSWTLAFACALPSLINSKVMSRNGTVYCSPYDDIGDDYGRYMTIFKATMFYFLPLTIIGILYSLMARKLQNSAREVQSIASSGCQVKNPQAQNRRHVARMVIVFILVFIICFLPHWIFQLWFWVFGDPECCYNHFWNYMRIAGFSLYFMNSTLNPLALYFVSSLFRQHFYHLLCCRKHSLERAASFSRGQSVYKKADNKVPVTFIDSSNYSVS